MTYRVFIDGQAGTTGLQIHERLAREPQVQLLQIAPHLRKDPQAKRDLMQEADLVVLCLHDEAARDSVATIESLSGRQPRVLDASSAHRVSPGWVYGFAELHAGQAARIGQAQRVANPGCYPTGGIALLRPLVDAGLLPPDYPVVMSGYSGYSGGGRQMIERYEKHNDAPVLELYGLNLMHKHIAELQHYSALSRRPIFVPAVGSFHSGMIDQIGLQLDLLHGVTSASQLHDCLASHYTASQFVKVIPPTQEGRVEPTALNHTNHIELCVWGNDALGQAVLTARYDNLGKGASGAAVQNLRLMLKI